MLLGLFTPCRLAALAINGIGFAQRKTRYMDKDASTICVLDHPSVTAPNCAISIPIHGHRAVSVIADRYSVSGEASG
ncbi:hypothetical protein N658DRAFT_493146 [Parathielavia hyrcaniae]|uniref:Uncharacterized protein n=1 Tax=Parathielavia hyrcaniae TaxID=113614 RepID=A0AAN6QD64_9PEZI|nr:hypothetical protein N658DRAFT_493146 [Parathielavia hyrcaniae]